ncbi:hypothetical protein [Kytococcus sedentarius]|uniref:hypothetical protein n=1 Tax=Kytococcus sedentarius TaxID=1276 RepID=UPI00194EAA87|nr:hypothetical protein [Kytococcus sedentarius]QRO87975.1 hypothetical protein I6J30_03165 [Kytococcus sedentarius]
MTTQVENTLAVGMTLPQQASAVTCGAASLVVAQRLLERMPLPAADDPVEVEDFQGAEFARFGRTNNPWEAGVLRVPWPMALGTPPWGALAELRGIVRQERGGQPRYRMDLVRWGRVGSLGESLQSVGTHEPALLYVGTRVVPRHVCVLAEDAGGRLALYDPAHGSVVEADVDALAAGEQRVAGWSQPWVAIAPR